MKLKKGKIYNHKSLDFIGWTDGDGSGSEGYNVADYFDADGHYLGADQHGIEPIPRGTTDSEILTVVAETLAADREENWVDDLDSALTEAGVDLHDEQPDGCNPWEIVRLADGRMVSLSDESGTGAARYRIA